MRVIHNAAQSSDPLPPLGALGYMPRQAHPAQGKRGKRKSSGFTGFYSEEHARDKACDGDQLQKQTRQNLIFRKLPSGLTTTHSNSEKLTFGIAQ